jgi:hypothetical protein
MHSLRRRIQLCDYFQFKQQFLLNEPGVQHVISQLEESHTKVDREAKELELTALRSFRQVRM